MRSANGGPGPHASPRDPVHELAEFAELEAKAIVRLSNAETPEAISRIADTIVRNLSAYQGGPALAALVVRRLRSMASERQMTAGAEPWDVSPPQNDGDVLALSSF